MRLRLITVVLAGVGATFAAAPSLPARASAVRPARPRPAAPAAIVARLRAAGLRGPGLAEALARLAAAGSAGPAAVMTSGTITGAVRGLRGAPLGGVCVTATGPAGTASAVSGTDGRYTLRGLRPGRYTLAYRDCAAPARYFRQFSGGAAWPSLATQVGVAAGQVRAEPLVTLQPTSRTARRLRTAPSGGTGRISGVVTGNGRPLRGICVIEWQVHNGFADGFSKQTSRTGRYSFGHLPRGRYEMQFAEGDVPCGRDRNWLPQWYKGITSAFDFPPGAKVIHLRAGQALGGVDARLRLGGQISGTVTNRSGRGLSGICVTETGRIRAGFVATSARTGRGGRYALHALFPGRYTIGFSIGCGTRGNYALQWWRRAATFRRATPIRITGHRVASRVDAVLTPGAAITGVVRGINSAGPPLRGVCVNAETRAGASAFARTRSDGSYRLRGLPTGRVSVGFDPSCSPTSNYLPQTRLVFVTAGRTRTGIDAFLHLGAVVAGTVTDSHGHPLDGICVDIQGSRGGFAESETGTGGSYSADGLPSGTYTVAFSNCDNPGSYAPQWYKNQASEAGASPVRLTAGTVTTGIDAAMQPGGTLTGVVTNLAGRRLDNVCVGLVSQDLASLGLGGEVFTDIEFTSNGSYQAQNLVPGPYFVNFGCGGGPYASQWFRSRSSQAAADLVSVGPGVVTRGIGAALRRAGVIRGVVTNRAGRRLSDICVTAVRGSGGVFGAGAIGPVFTQNGAYRIDGLPAGRYRVQFTDCTERDRYAVQWYKGRTTLASATSFRVAPGRTTRGIGAALAVGGSISGTVTGSTRRPLRNVCVVGFNARAQAFGFALSNRRGQYRMAGLATGSYRVTFSPCFGQNLVSVARARAVRVTAPHAVTGINARLSAGGTITGTVLGGSPAKPLSGICVEVLPTSANSISSGFAVTGPSGGYTATGLASGGYQVLFGDPFCPFGATGFAPQWFNDKPTQASADVVHVTAGSTTTGIGATLRAGRPGVITGTVTGPSAAPVTGECVTAFPVHVAVPSSFGSASPEIAVTDSQGRYRLGFLLPGSYQVRFDVGCGATGLATQWWKDAASRQGATLITVPASATVPGIDATLHG